MKASTKAREFRKLVENPFESIAVPETTATVAEPIAAPTIRKATDFPACSSNDVSLANISFIFPQRVTPRTRREDPAEEKAVTLAYVNFSVMGAVLDKDGIPVVDAEGKAQVIMIPINGGRIKQLVTGVNPDGTQELSENGPFLSLDRFPVKDQTGAVRWLNIINLKPEQSACLVRLYLKEVARKAVPQAVMA